MVLLVVTAPGHPFDPPLRARIRTALAREASPAHVPAVIVDVPELPVTHSGKSSEVAATEALRARESANIGALRNPGCLRTIADRVADHDAAAARALAAAPVGDVEQELSRIWEGVLGEPAGPDDDFFECGGTSLLTAPLFQQIADRLGRRLPLSTILHAPTISSLAALVGDDLDHGWGTLELLRARDLAATAVRRTWVVRGPAAAAAPGRAHRPRPDCVRPAGARPDGRRAPAGDGRGNGGGADRWHPITPAARAVRPARLLAGRCRRRRDRAAAAQRRRAGRVPRRCGHPLQLGLPRDSRGCRTGAAAAAEVAEGSHRRSGPDAASQPAAARGRARRGRRPAGRSHPGGRPAGGGRVPPPPVSSTIVYFRAAIPSLLQVDATAVWRRAAAVLVVERVPGHHDELVRLHVADLARVVNEHLPSAR